MKAQIASFEALLSVLLAAGAAATIATATPYYLHLMDASRIRHGDFLYDFVSAVYGNASVAGCMASGSAPCITGLLRSFSRVYSLPYVELDYGQSQYQYGASAWCSSYSRACFPMRRNDTFSIWCVMTCGG